MEPTYNYNYEGSLPPEAAAGMFAIFGGLMLFMVVVFVVIYVLVAISLVKIARRTNTENSWFAWIPILNIILMLQIAQRPMWWLVFFLVPFVNIVGIVLNFLLWIDIAKRLGQSPVIGFFAGLIPVIFIPYLAFSGSSGATETVAA